MKGYLEKGPIREAFFPTKDMGYLDEDGFLFLEGRKDDVFKSGGEKVSCNKIASLLLSHPLVREAWVFPIEHEWLGQVPGAYIVAERKGIEKEVKDFLRSHLSYHEVPYKIRIVSDIPRTSSGKILCYPRMTR